MSHFGSHADALAQCGVRVDGFFDVHFVGTHLDGQCHLTDHVASVRADSPAAQDPAVTVGPGGVVKQQLGDALVVAIGNGSP